MGKNKEPPEHTLKFINPAFFESKFSDPEQGEQEKRIKYDTKDIFGTDADANGVTYTGRAFEKNQEPSELEWDDEMLQDLAFAFDACDIQTGTLLDVGALPPELRAHRLPPLQRERLRKTDATFLSILLGNSIVGRDNQKQGRSPRTGSKVAPMLREEGHWVEFPAGEPSPKPCGPLSHRNVKRPQRSPQPLLREYPSILP